MTVLVQTLKFQQNVVRPGQNVVRPGQNVVRPGQNVQKTDFLPIFARFLQDKNKSAAVPYSIDI